GRRTAADRRRTGDPETQLIVRRTNSIMVNEEQLIALISEKKSPLQHLRIEPSSGFVPLKVKEIWEFRELLYFLVWRDIKVRYKHTAAGSSWAIIQPVLTVVVFSIFFGKLGKLSSDGVPYPIFAFAALVPWTLFSNGLTQGTNS